MVFLGNATSSQINNDDMRFQFYLSSIQWVAPTKNKGSRFHKAALNQTNLNKINKEKKIATQIETKSTFFK